MKRFSPLAAFMVLVAADAARAEAADYVPLALYAGAWTATLRDPEGKASTAKVANACARVGTNFACQQSVNGTPGAMVVFLPAGGGGKWLTQNISAGGQAGGEPGDLTIDGPVWTFISRAKTGAGMTWTRNLNTFRDANHIHFEISTSMDGETWKPGLSGDEVRS